MSQKTEPIESNIWSSLLDRVSSGRRLLEKQIFLCGGSPITQKEFLDLLSPGGAKRSAGREQIRVPVANDFALGYTYQDVLDTDQEDTLARLSIYTLPHSSPSFVSLLGSLLNTSSVPETLIVILLDWNEPWNWPRQLRAWIKVLRRNLSLLDQGVKESMENLMRMWEQRRHDVPYESSTAGNHSSPVPNFLGPGEWDEAVGLPLCVACHNCERMDDLEKEYGWREEDFDYVLQFLRTILLKYGSSLIYTSNSMASSLPLLVQSSLGIQSLLKRQPLKHNIVDRENILIPPCWDSWGKIRVLRDGFDVEGVSKDWSEETRLTQDELNQFQNSRISLKNHGIVGQGEKWNNMKGPVADYENVIRDPKGHASNGPSQEHLDRLDTDTPMMQHFLAGQSEVIDRMKAEEQYFAKGTKGSHLDLHTSGVDLTDSMERENSVREHIGPMIFNIGGIQGDAEEMLDHLQKRTGEKTSEDESQPEVPFEAENKAQNEALANFFAGLIKRKPASSSTT